MKKEKWDELQQKSLDKYRKTKEPKGIFSYDGMKSAKNLGEILNEMIPFENCLDVGCGMLPMPYYMKAADNVLFHGVDPYDDEVLRGFVYFCAVAEELPYDDEVFDNILYATSLDHFYDPELAVAESRRVLKGGGLIFVWTALLGSGGDENHPLGYDDESIKMLFDLFEFVEMRMINTAEYLYIFRK